MGTKVMKRTLFRALLLPCLLAALITGCALVKPTRHYEEATPVDWGLAGAYLGTAAVTPFAAPEYEEWGMYSAHRLSEYLFENKAFRQVAVAMEPDPKTSYIISGTLEHLAYGGSQGPTSVFLVVKVTSTSDSQVRFYRSAKASSSRSAFHMTWLRSVDVPSPYIEEVLNGVLKDVASDIASRTHSPAVQLP